MILIEDPFSAVSKEKIEEKFKMNWSKYLTEMESNEGRRGTKRLLEDDYEDVASNFQFWSAHRNAFALKLAAF